MWFHFLVRLSSQLPQFRPTTLMKEYSSSRRNTLLYSVTIWSMYIYVYKVNKLAEVRQTGKVMYCTMTNEHISASGKGKGSPQVLAGSTGGLASSCYWNQCAKVLPSKMNRHIFQVFNVFFQMLWIGCHYWNVTAPHILWSYSIRPFNKSIDHSETIIFPMDHQQLVAAGSNRYSWIRWSCPHATCQIVTNNHVAAYYSLTSLRGWQLAFIHIYAPLSSACFFQHQWRAGHLETKTNPLCVC